MRNMSIQWDRVAPLRTPLLILMAIVAIAIGLFHLPHPYDLVFGWVWIGVGLAFVAYATDSEQPANGRVIR